MAVANTSSYSQIMDPSFSRIHFNNYTKVPLVLDKVARMMTSSRNFEKEAVMSGLPGHNTKPEGSPVSFEFPASGHEKTQLHTSYGLGFAVTEEMQDDDLTTIINRMPAELGKSAAYTRELQYWDLFNSGFGATHTTADGQFLFDTDHDMLKAGADIGNEPSSGGALSQTTLEAGFDHFDSEITTHAGIPVQMTAPYKLIIPYALRWIAKELDINPWERATTDHNMNTLQSEAWDYLVVRYLTSTTAWFLLSQEHDLRFMWRKQIQFRSGDDFATGNALFKSTMRFSVWAANWQGSYGNPGV